MNSYWIRHPRGFANEFDIGIATDKQAADLYHAQGYLRIARAEALSRMVYRDDATTVWQIGLTVDGNATWIDRRAMAECLRNR